MKDTPTIGDLVSLFYEEFLAMYGDEDMAEVAAAATINELLAERAEQPFREEAA